MPELIDLAESHNPETRVAWERARAQAAALGVARSELYPTLAAAVLSGVARSQAYLVDRFYRQTIADFHRQNIECRRDFYNFIQDPLPGPKVQPSREVWTRAIPAFTEVLQKLEPQFVLVLARDLWNQISTIPKSPSISVSDGKTSTGRFYELPSRSLSFFFPINHPSSVGWSYKNWCPCVKVAIQEAINVFLTGTPRIESTCSGW